MQIYINCLEQIKSIHLTQITEVEAIEGTKNTNMRNMKKEDRKENKLKIVPWWVSIQIYVSNITELVRVLRWSVLPLSPAACPWTDWGGPPGVQPPDRELPSARPPRPPLSQHRFLSPPLSWGGGDRNVRSNQGRMAGKYVIHRLITILFFFFFSHPLTIPLSFGKKSLYGLDQDNNQA